jgi:hypothetical protein
MANKNHYIDPRDPNAPDCETYGHTPVVKDESADGSRQLVVCEECGHEELI